MYAFCRLMMVGSLIFSATCSCWGQSESEKPLQAFQFMLGNWQGEYESPNDVPELKIEKGQLLAFSQTNRFILGGAAVEMNVQRQIDRGTTIQTKEVITWDPGEKKLVHRFFGQGMYGGGHWEKDGEAMVLTWKLTSEDGRVYQGTSICKPRDDNTYSWQIVNSSVNDKPLSDTPLVELSRMPNALSPGQEKMKALSFLIGEWESQSEEGSNGQMTCRWINNESFIEMRSGDYLEIYGWDPHEERYIGFGFGTHGGFGKLMWRQEGDVWHLEADPLFYDRLGQGLRFEVHLKPIDETTVEASGRFGTNRWSEVRKKVSAKAHSKN